MLSGELTGVGCRASSGIVDGTRSTVLGSKKALIVRPASSHGFRDPTQQDLFRRLLQANVSQTYSVMVRTVKQASRSLGITLDVGRRTSCSTRERKPETLSRE